MRRLERVLLTIAGRLPFATPVIETIGADGDWLIERRLPGRPMAGLFGSLGGDGREVALRNYLAATASLRAVTFPDRPYGELVAHPALTAAGWHDYLRRGLDRFARRNAATIKAAFGNVSALVAAAERRLDGIDRHPPKALVHGDWFPGNVLLDERLAVSAVLDFSAFTLVGDPLLDVVCATAFVAPIEPFTARDGDRALALAHRSHGPALIAAEPFYRAYCAFCLASPAYAAPPYPRLHAWSLAELARLA
jgi:hypothetical protein